MKICTKCGVEKSPCEFNKQKRAKDGLHCICKLCIREYDKQRYQDHKEQYEQYHQDHKEQRNKYNKQWREDHKEERNEYGKKYYQDNQEKYFAYEAKRRATKLNQTPIDADKQAIEQLYHICIETNEILSFIYFHVDHIQPLSKDGAHHQDNLQILEVDLNKEKFNKWPLTDEEQTRYKGYKNGK